MMDPEAVTDFLSKLPLKYVNCALGFVVASLMGYFIARTVQSTRKFSRGLWAEFTDAMHRYNADLPVEELIQTYLVTLKADRNFFREKKKTTAAFRQMIEARLDDIIRKEIAAACTNKTYEGIIGGKKTAEEALAGLSPTYKTCYIDAAQR